ncbi:pantetheine-phosphate adenylyltransferase [Micropruina sonneratiae]|uniref:pantetheine-phosphate adenylyltransferase n=1 Tax=Micropruina sonneratiae TaxID=2986940 RepID=UPI0022264901|nr:pantetheine-phosphate adenylyltransferase [Micropruina sp. KQZ13P-5]MCW3157333.1 pantetheine-phosphate adenylyltransferase [Micropruina sp. KQZ13P-5]
MRAVCPGSFDPITHGHVDIITRAAELFDEVIVAVGRNSAKNYLFDTDERVELAAAAVAGVAGVRVEVLSGLLVDFCRDRGAGVVVKGLRFASDFDFELQMAHINGSLTGLETVLLPASAKWGTLSSTMIREVASLGGDVSAFVPALVAQRIDEKKRDNSNG